MAHAGAAHSRDANRREVRPARLVVLKVNQLGDNLVFVAVVQQFRRLWPAGALTLCTTPVAAPLYGGALAPTEVIAMPRGDFNRAWRRPREFFRLWRRLRHTRPQACLISFDQGSLAHVLARLSGSPIRVGSAGLAISAPDGLTHRVAYEPGTRVAQWNWEMGRTLARALGREDWPAEPVAPDLRHLVRPLPRSARPRILIHAGASLPYRQWPPERFAALASRLARDCDVVWVARPEVADVSLPNSIHRIAGDTLTETASWLAHSDLYVGNNSGPLHLAAALGCPGLVLSGPSHFQWDPAWHPDRFRVLRAPDLPCLPCENPGGAPQRCLNRERPMACMDYWSVTEVERLAREWLVRHRDARRERGET